MNGGVCSVTADIISEYLVKIYFIVYTVVRKKYDGWAITCGIYQVCSHGDKFFMSRLFSSIPSPQSRV